MKNQTIIMEDVVKFSNLFFLYFKGIFLGISCFVAKSMSAPELTPYGMFFF